ESPADGFERARHGIERELEAILTDGAWRAGDTDVASEQHRIRIAVPEQRFDSPVEPIDADLEVDPNFRNEIGRSEHRARDFVEARGKVRNLVSIDGDSGSGTVAAVAQQMLARLTQS